MIELIVAFALCLSSLVLAALLWQWLASRSEGGREVLRLLGAVRRAGSDFLWQEGRLLGLSLVVVLAALASTGVVWRASGISAAHVAWSAAGLGLGAGATALMAYVALRTGIGITARVVEALRLGSTDAVAATLRGSALVAVWTDASSLLLAVGLLALPGWHLGSQSVLSPEWVAITLRLLPAAALGAVVAAAVFQLGGVNFNTAAGVASLAARKQDPSLLADRDRNPALVAELVGGYVGAVAARVTDYFAALVLANSAMLLVCTWVHAQNAGGAVLGVIALPVVVRAAGLVASTIALSSMRFERGESTSRTFSAAELGAAVVACVGLFGASLWLLGDGLFLRYFAAGVLGVSANGVAAAITHYRLRKNIGSGAFSASRVDARAARALGQGLQQTWALILGFGVCILLAWLLGSGSALRAGGPLGLVLVLSGVLSAGLFGLTRDLFSRLTEAVLTIAHASRSELDALGRARAQELDGLGVELGGLGRTQGIFASAGAAGLTALSLATVGSGVTAAAAAPASTTAAFPVALWGGALGAGMLLFYVGGALKTSSRTAAAVAEDIAQRLAQSSEGPEPAPAQGGLDVPSREVIRLPSYRVSVQLATQSATERLLPLTLITVLMPLALAFVLRVVYGPEGQVVTAHGLAAFAAIATLTGSCTAFAAEGAEALLAYARRHASAQASSEAPAPGVEFIGRSVGPAALLGVKATVVAALVSGPLLFGN